jgi:hypothetical protein
MRICERAARLAAFLCTGHHQVEAPLHHRTALVFNAAALIAAVLWITGIACSSVMRALRSGP